MPWTLDDALQECARNTYNDKVMVRTSTGYQAKGLSYARRFLSGINYAIAMIARERLGQYRTQEVTLNDRGRFDVSALTGSVIRVNSIYSNAERIMFDQDVNETVMVPGYENSTVTVNYEVVPDQLTLNDLDTILPIDERYIDPRVLCQYANYQVLSESGTEYDSTRAQVWLGLFNNSFANVMPTNRLPRKVRYTG
jgi:hypothetical protein